MRSGAGALLVVTSATLLETSASLLVTSASLLVTSALLVVTMSLQTLHIRNRSKPSSRQVGQARVLRSEGLRLPTRFSLRCVTRVQEVFETQRSACEAQAKHLELHVRNGPE